MMGNESGMDAVERAGKSVGKGNLRMAALGCDFALFIVVLGFASLVAALASPGVLHGWGAAWVVLGSLFMAAIICAAVNSFVRCLWRGIRAADAADKPEPPEPSKVPDAGPGFEYIGSVDAGVVDDIVSGREPGAAEPGETARSKCRREEVDFLRTDREGYRSWLAGHGTWPERDLDWDERLASLRRERSRRGR